MGLGRILPCLLCFLFLTACSVKHPGDTVDSRKPALSPGDFLTCPTDRINSRELLKRLEGSRYLLLGEAHRSPCDHRAHVKVISTLAEAKQKFCIGLEMIDTEKQPVLDRFNSGALNPEELETALEWEQNWGYDYTLYLPVFELARKFSLPVYALNLPKTIVREISRRGLNGLSPKQKEQLPRKLIRAPKEQKKILSGFFSGHSRMLTNSTISQKNFFLAQSVWESKMAETAHYWQKKLEKPMIVIAGSGHVETGWGIGYRLQKLDPRAKTTRILPKRKVDCRETNRSLFFYCPSRPPHPLGMVFEKRDGKIFVKEVIDDSKADDQNIKRGAELLAAGNKKIDQIKDLHFAAMDAKNKNNDLCLDIIQDGQNRTVCFKLGSVRK